MCIIDVLQKLKLQHFKGQPHHILESGFYRCFYTHTQTGVQ